uniref:Uncharacterized protein n=1 Tax=Arundo donax TaxID=35708 RepID=A0A0A8ZCF6_ARUDO
MVTSSSVPKKRFKSNKNRARIDRETRETEANKYPSLFSVPPFANRASASVCSCVRASA